MSGRASRRDNWLSVGSANLSRADARLVFVDSSFNPRIGAQRGLFLLAAAYRQRATRDARANWKPIDRLEIPAFADTPVRRYDLPTRHAPRMLEYLAHSGVDAGTVYPDHEGAWRAARERLQIEESRTRRFRALDKRLLRRWGSDLKGDAD